ncbi:MAG: DHHW family protein [Limosilactobacillus sp.]|uniref:DHHW family protein n=1 Tax=Limosilactobacillus sp. TaxID=2773925 RepID=UPI002A75F381|nr:DHHW family protein [Limosilactobacillus sp.]MDY2802703.1 DHHW family protein [Limosilactobacillus sp.]
MNKKYNLFLTLLFCGFLGLFLVWHLVLPDADFSPTENRYLAQRPTPTFGLEFLGKTGNFFTGEFMEDFETYVNDQFPLRDGWVGLKARAERLSGKQSNNGVYFGTDGQSLIADYPEPDAAKVEKNLNYVSLLGEKLNVPVWFSLIPGKSEAWSSLLPAGAPVGDQQTVLDLAAQTENVTWIDLSTRYMVEIGEKATFDYYFTDHHWTTRGAYDGYVSLMEGMGLTALPLGDLTTVTENFHGTTWSSSGAYWYQPDSMEIAVSDDGVTVTNFFDGTPTEGALYNYEKLEQKDKYPFFLGGNQPLCVIQSEKPGASGRLLVIRDSFSDSLAPFLTQNFAEIHLIDLRYYKASLAQYVEMNRIDQVLVLYSVDNFVTDSNLFVMGM